MTNKGFYRSDKGKAVQNIVKILKNKQHNQSMPLHVVSCHPQALVRHFIPGQGLFNESSTEMGKRSKQKELPLQNLMLLCYPHRLEFHVNLLHCFKRCATQRKDLPCVKVNKDVLLKLHQARLEM